MASEHDAAFQVNPPRNKRKGGRKRDPIWKETTVRDDNFVICNRCQAVIHRYGRTKVERVRAHFELKCAKKMKFSHPNDTNGDNLAAMVSVGAGGLPVGGISSGRNRKSDHMTKNGIFKRRFAQWIYATGQLFDDVENILLLKALRALRADVVVPSRFELENELLDLEYNGSLTKVQKAISGKACCLTVENWADASGNIVTNYGAICENVSYFLEAISTESNEPVTELGYNELEAVLTKHKKGIFYGVVTPVTTFLSKTLREILQKKHSQCVFFHGCVFHALQLLVNDVLSILPNVQAVHTSVVELISVFQNDHKLQTHLHNLQIADNKPPLEFPDPSSSIYAALEAVLSCEKELYAIVSRRAFVDSSTPAEQERLKRVQDFVLGEAFVQDLNNALQTLRPLQLQLARFQNDNAPISQVFPSFLELIEVYTMMENVNKKQTALITSCVHERFNSIYGDSHGVAYMLDPLYLGKGLDMVKRQEVENFIVNYFEGQPEVNIIAQLEKYKEMVAELKECNHAYWDMLVSGTVNAFEFWMERRQFPQLQQLAWVVFGLPVASTAPNKAFAAQGRTIHSRFHSKLPADKVQKLMHLYCNGKSNNTETELASLTVADPDPRTAAL